MAEKESKLASYWNTPFTKICLGMRANGDSKWMMLDYKASSLYSVIADGQYSSTSSGRAAWMSLITNSSLQRHCNQEGFNIRITWGSGDMLSTRLGLVANNEVNCETCDSWIGFGVHYKGCSSEHDLACGNGAPCVEHVDRVANIAAFGYILVQ